MMTMNKHRLLAIAALLLAVLAITATASPVLAQAGANETDNGTDTGDDATTGLPTRDADLVVRQPKYADGDVSQQTHNGTPVYEVNGDRLLLNPRNFGAAEALNYGVDAPAGELRYDSGLEVFTFEPGQNNTGTFELWWVVEEQTTITENNTTTTATRQVRYEALIRVDGQTNMAHVEASTMLKLRENAEFGTLAREAIADIRDKDLLLARDEGTDTEILEAMATRYVTTGDPIYWLSGSYTQMWMMVVLGGAGATIFVLQFFVGFGYIIRQLRIKLNRTESIKDEEGELAERLAEVDHEEHLRKFANLDWNDVTDDDHFASKLRETLGENPLRGWQTYNSVLRPRNVFRDRIQAMGLAGYQARVDRDADGVIRDAEIIPSDDVDDAEGELVELEQPDEDLVDAIDPDAKIIREFDLADAEVDLSQLDTTYETMDLDELIEAFDADMEAFGDREAYGEYLLELFESIREHEFTDDEGRPDELRYVLEMLLDISHQFHDVFRAPLADYQRDATAAAINNWDRNDEARQYVREVRSGNAD